MEIIYDDDGATEALSWVFQTSNLAVPFVGEAIDTAVSKGIHLGLHWPSKSIVVILPGAQRIHQATGHLSTIFGGGAAKKMLTKKQALDLYHAECWGIINVLRPGMPEYFDTLVEEDDSDSEEDVPDCPDQDASQSAQDEKDIDMEEEFPKTTLVEKNIFDLVVHLAPRKIIVPGRIDAMLMDTKHEKELRASMESSGNSLTPYLAEVLFPRGLQHIHQVQEEARALARKKSDVLPILWVTEPPSSLTIYRKPNMPKERRVEWIKWKAQKLGLELTLPVFMALYKQMTPHAGIKGRLEQFKTLVALWQGKETLDWKEFPDSEKFLIKNINEGKLDCYCRSCDRVLDPKLAKKFCCAACAGNFCRCGARKKSRWVSDYDQLEAQQKQLGPYTCLVELATMLQYRADVELCQIPGDITPKFAALTEARRARQCCKAVEGFLDKRWCERCLSEFSRLTSMSRCAEKILSGKVTWGHCQEASRQLEKLRDMPTPKMEEKYCDEPGCKRIQV